MAETKTLKPMHTVCLRLDTSEYEGYLIDRSFHALSHIHNVLVKHAQKLLIHLKYDKDYQQLRTDVSERLALLYCSRSERPGSKETDRRK